MEFKFHRLEFFQDLMLHFPGLSYAEQPLYLFMRIIRLLFQRLILVSQR